MKITFNHPNVDWAKVKEYRDAINTPSFLDGLPGPVQVSISGSKRYTVEDGYVWQLTFEFRERDAE